DQACESNAVVCATAGPSFTTTVTAGRDLLSPGAAPAKWSILQCRKPAASRPVLSSAAPLRQRDALERTDDVVRAFFGKEAFVISRAEVPVRAFVIIIAVKAPNTAHHDEATDAVIPKITDVMKTQVGTRVGSPKSG